MHRPFPQTRGFVEKADLLFGKLALLARFQVPERERAVIQPHQLEDAVAELLEDPPDLSFFALVQDDQEAGLARVLFLDADLARRRAAVLEFDAGLEFLDR